VSVFKKWRRASCSAYTASRKHYDLSREELDESYKDYEKSCGVISEDESVDPDVAIYDNTDNVNSNGEIVEGSRHDLNDNESEMPAGSVANKEAVSGFTDDGKMNNLNNMSKPSDSRLKYLISNWLFEKDANNDIRTMFKKNNNLCSKEIALGYLDRDDLLSLPRMKNSASISLTKSQVRMILDIIDYYNLCIRMEIEPLQIP